jgi:ribose 5-phosphate isomerase RpiB
MLDVLAMSETTTLPPLAVAFGTDHAGIALKDVLGDVPRAEGFAVHDPASGWLCCAHNDANVLALGARVIDRTVALDCLRAFIGTRFDGGRQAVRVARLGRAGKVAA